MSNPQYAADWAAKKAWYVANGYRPYDEPNSPGSRGVLVWTDDQEGVDQPAWAAIARQVIGTAGARRVAKKAARKRIGQ